MTTRWGLVEEPSYDAARAGLDISVKRLDDLLIGATWLIARAGDDDSCTTDIDGIRLVKTRMAESSDLLRLWYWLDFDTMLAHLLHIDIEHRATEEDTPW